MFSEILFPSKLYLTAGLHGAVMQVIVDDKEYLDYEISKVLSRYTPKDILKRFGPPGQSSTNTKIKEYVVIMKGKLIRLCKKFMKSLIQKIYCFPHRYTEVSFFQYILKTHRFFFKFVFLIESFHLLAAHKKR